METWIIVILTALIGPILVEIFRDKFLKTKKDTFLDSLKVDSNVTTRLEEIKESAKADRVILAQFHNGGNFYPTGRSMQKFSIVYELKEPSISSLIVQYQNIPVSLFSKMMDLLHEGDMMKFPDDSIGQSWSYNLTEALSFKTGYIFPLITLDNKFIGFIAVHYVDNEVMVGENTLNNIKVSAATITGVLVNKDLKK